MSPQSRARSPCLRRARSAPSRPSCQRSLWQVHGTTTRAIILHRSQIMPGLQGYPTRAHPSPNSHHPPYQFFPMPSQPATPSPRSRLRKGRWAHPKDSSSRNREASNEQEARLSTKVFRSRTSGFGQHHRLQSLEEGAPPRSHLSGRRKPVDETSQQRRRGRGCQGPGRVRVTEVRVRAGRVSDVAAGGGVGCQAAPDRTPRI